MAIKQQWVTSDGRTYDEREAAEGHERFILAEQRAQRATDIIYQVMGQADFVRLETLVPRNRRLFVEKLLPVLDRLAEVVAEGTLTSLRAQLQEARDRIEELEAALQVGGEKEDKRRFYNYERVGSVY